MKIVSSYVHALEGRLRIKIPEVKGAPLKGREIEGHLNLCHGVDEVSANPITGSILVLYNPRLISQEEIILSLKELGYLEEPSPQAPRTGGGGTFPENALSRVTSAIASTLLEVALSRLVAAII